MRLGTIWKRIEVFDGMMGGMVMMGIGGMMMVLWLLIFVAVVAFVVYLASRYGRRDVTTLGEPKHRDNALRIIRERNAKGEIDSATYEKMKNDLE